ncbi:MAG: hypothetical protein AAGG09_03135 [Pseudomonadota bacterium]
MTRRQSTLWSISGPTLRGLAVLLAGLGLAAPAAAQTLTEQQARQQVASSRGVQVVVADLDFIDAATKRQFEQAGKQFPYYGAFVLSPGDPQSNQSGLAAANYHSPQAAVEAALRDCNARRTTGDPCVVVAQTYPRGYEAGGLTLSTDATEALRGDFRRLDSPKALAISPTTGHFAFARGDGARAQSACNAAAGASGAQDCRVVVVDP